MYYTNPRLLTSLAFRLNTPHCTNNILLLLRTFVKRKIRINTPYVLYVHIDSNFITAARVRLRNTGRERYRPGETQAARDTGRERHRPRDTGRERHRP